LKIRVWGAVIPAHADTPDRGIHMDGRQKHTGKPDWLSDGKLQRLEMGPGPEAGAIYFMMLPYPTSR
jgi:hypothetical protein